MAVEGNRRRTRPTCYAVAVGRKVGIFDTWTEAEAQIRLHPGALHRGFPARDQAEEWMRAQKGKSPTRHDDDV